MKKLVLLFWLYPFLVSGQVSSNMTLLSNLDLPDLPTRFGAEYGDIWGFRHSNGTEIAILSAIESIFFIDITSPANPTIIYDHPVENLPNGNINKSLWRDFKTYGNYIYACADEGTSGLIIFDVSQLPASVTMVYQSVDFFTRSHTIYIDEQHGRLYAAGSNTVSNGLVILDLASDPENPELLGNVPLNSVGGGYVHALYVRDHIGYCSHGSLSKIQIYDFTSLPNFSVLGSIEGYPEEGYNHSSWLNADGNFLVMADETHGSDLKLVNVTDPANISADDITTFYSELLGPDVQGASIAHNPYILGDFAYVSYYHDGVQVFDITDPQNVQVLAYYDTYPDNTDYQGYEGCWGVYPFLPSGVIIASDMTYGLYVMEVTEFPLDIQFLSFEASRQNGAVRLNWTVAEASFGHTFQVMKSADNGMTFEKIGETYLQDQEPNYSFMDRDVYKNQSYVYRIDFLEDDGHRIPSPMRFVRTHEKYDILSIANPINDLLVITATEPLVNMKFKIFDIEGKIMWSQTLDQSKPVMEFPIEYLVPGSYVLTAQWLGGTMNRLIQKVD